MNDDEDLVKGGQGRTNADVSDDGMNVIWLAFGMLVLALALALSQTSCAHPRTAEQKLQDLKDGK